MAWLEIKLTVVESLKDVVVARLFELGAIGVDESNLAKTDSISIFFEETQGKSAFQELGTFTNRLAELNPSHPRLKAELLPVKEENWSDRYKEFYKAQKLTSLFYLKPAWDDKAVVPEEMIPIILEPGQAFGTGLHQSTKLSMQLIESTMELLVDPINSRVLDVGTGTGILAIAAWKLGLRDVAAIDNDPLAVEAALENIQLNDCPGIKVSGEPLQTMKPGYNLIVSNILLETHQELGKEYRRLLAPKGQLILAGILGQQKSDLDRLMLEIGFVPETVENLQEWAAVRYVTHG